VDLIGNDCKLFLRLFLFYFLIGVMPGMLLFDSENEMDCKNYLGDFWACGMGWNWVVESDNGNWKRELGEGESSVLRGDGMGGDWEQIRTKVDDSIAEGIR
jgi:hypothetical protein